MSTVRRSFKTLAARARAYGDRPIPAGDHKLAASAIAVSLVLAAFGLILLPHAPENPAAGTTSTSPAAVHALPTAPPQAVPAVEPPRPATRRDLRGAKRAARRFLTGYLAYTYGRVSARRIPRAVPSLRAELAAKAPRVPARERHRRARITVLQTEDAASRRADMLALITDGRRTYSLRVTLTLDRRGVWTATGIDGA